MLTTAGAATSAASAIKLKREEFVVLVRGVVTEPSQSEVDQTATAAPAPASAALASLL
jgi:hypothetical protein